MFLDFIYIPLFVFIATLFPRMVLNDHEHTYLRSLQNLALFHFIFGLAYFFTTNNGGGDAWGHWLLAKEMSNAEFLTAISSGEGTAFMRAFNYPFANLMNMSFLSNTMFYSMLGSIGVTLFAIVALRTIPFNKRLGKYVLFPLLFFLPNLHFWSGGVGKDTTLFLCIALFTYGVMKPVTRLPIIILGLSLAMAIRPHIVLFLVAGFGLAYLFGGKIPVWQRTVFSVLMMGAGIAILPSVMEFAKIEEASVQSFDKFAQGKASALSRDTTGSSVDISSYPFPLKVLTFWFRPFFFDARNINGLLASIENAILVIVFFKAMRLKPLRAFRKAPFVIKGLVFFLIFGTLAFSQSLGNVGIMIRMRNMFLPGMLIFLLWIFSYDQQRRLQQQRTLKQKT